MNLPVLAQVLNDAQERQVMVWGGVLILMAVGGFGLIMYLKKYMRDRANQGKNDAGFSLSELKQMLYRGEITPEEYETTKAHVIAKVKGKLGTKPRPVKKPQAGADSGGGDGGSPYGAGGDTAADGGSGAGGGGGGGDGGSSD